MDVNRIYGNERFIIETPSYEPSIDQALDELEHPFNPYRGSLPVVEYSNSGESVFKADIFNFFPPIIDKAPETMDSLSEYAERISNFERYNASFYLFDEEPDIPEKAVPFDDHMLREICDQ